MFQTIASGTPVAPFTITEWRTNNQTDPTGRTQGSRALVEGESTAIFLVFGDSMSANFAEAPYDPAETKVQELSIYDGNVYQCKSPVLGASGALDCWSPRLGEYLIDQAVYQRVIFISCGQSGSRIAEWSPGGNYNHRLMNAIMRSRTLVMPDGSSAPITAVLCAIGPNDADAGVSQVAWESSFAAVKLSIRNANSDAPLFVPLVSKISGVDSPTIRAAQAAVVNGTDVFSAPDMDALGHRADNTHLSNAGSAAYATALGAILATHF